MKKEIFALSREVFKLIGHAAIIAALVLAFVYR